jgi:hypothetical protein
MIVLFHILRDFAKSLIFALEYLLGPHHDINILLCRITTTPPIPSISDNDSFVHSFTFV